MIMYVVAQIRMAQINKPYVGSDLGQAEELLKNDLMSYRKKYSECSCGQRMSVASAVQSPNLLIPHRGTHKPRQQRRAAAHPLLVLLLTIILDPRSRKLHGPAAAILAQVVSHRPGHKSSFLCRATMLRPARIGTVGLVSLAGATTARLWQAPMHPCTAALLSEAVDPRSVFSALSRLTSTHQVATTDDYSSMRAMRSDSRIT